jgi:hypothetical protein
MMGRSAALIIVTALAVVPAAAHARETGGIREIKSKHLTLYTDLAADDELDALGDQFDQAFGQWCAYFEVDPDEHADWHVRACLMHAREPFQAAGLLPADLPRFDNAFSRDGQLWMYDQTSVYYRRHLLLHEGTHCFMHTLLGGTGPPWYAEGMAELLATHRIDGKKLSLGYFPRSPDEVSKWGRIEIVQSAYARHRAKTLQAIAAYGGTLHADVEPYGWCWAAAAFLDGHPRYRDRFRQLSRHVTAADFQRRIDEFLAVDRDRLDEDWQLYVANIDYGYDFRRMDVERSAGRPLDSKSASVTVQADRGWQSTGIALESGRKYHLRAAGQYVIAVDERPWVSEPGGVTIRYHHGQPLGILLAAVRSDEPPANGASGLIKPIVVGLDKTLVVNRPGTLYLRINDSAGRLDDNSGSARVEITPE